MNFDFTDEQKLFADAVRKFAVAHLEKDSLARAHDARFPFDVAALMSRQGLLGITPEDLHTWAARYFVRQNCVLWIAGSSPGTLVILGRPVVGRFGTTMPGAEASGL